MRKFIIQNMNCKTTPEVNMITANVKQIALPWSQDEIIECPKLLSKLSCGLFGITDDFIEKYQSLDQLFVKNRYSTFFFEAAGDSMEPTIFSGQILIIDRSLTDFHNRVCVLAYEEKLICKRVIQRNNHVILKSDNPKYRDIIVENSDSLIYWGVVIANAGFIK